MKKEVRTVVYDDELQNSTLRLTVLRALYSLFRTISMNTM